MSLEDLKKAYPFPEAEPTVPASDHGWFEPENERLLAGALGPHTRVVLELGSWLGKSTRFIARSAPNATVIAVDHWLGSEEHVGNPVLPVLYDTFLKNCWAFRDRIVPLRTSTIPGMGLVREHGVEPDLVYVDAGHDYASAKEDILTALDLFPGALLCGDDFLWPGVCKAVRDAVERCVMSACIKGNVWWREHPAFQRMNGVRIVAR
jgi:hypothetical protein